MSDFWKASGIGLVTAIALAALFFSVDLAPPLASWEASELDTLLRTYLAIMGAIFGLVVAFIAYSVAVFRRRQPGERGADFRGLPALQRGWIIVTTLLVLASAADATYVLGKIFSPRTGYAESDVRVDVKAAQWSWQFDYLDYGIQSNELVLPVNRPVQFRLTSRDVVHSFYIPEFRMKFAAMPGMTTQMYSVPTRLGTFRAECAELCGLGHTIMASPVRVVDAASFQQWVNEQKQKQSKR